SPWGEGFPGWHIECSAMSTKYLGKSFDIHGGGMDLQFPHHESEIAQSTICNGCTPVRYWIHNNMITINGKKMGKSYNNVIKLTELFSGEHPLLEKPYSPMTVRFFILQTHYSSTLNFSNEALQAAEKGLKRLMEAYGWLQKGELQAASGQLQAGPQDALLAANCSKLVASLQEFMDDDFNTAKVLASLFELVPVINSLKDKSIAPEALGADLLQRLQSELKLYVEDILGLKSESVEDAGVLQGVLQVLIDIRREARARKDWATSDRIRNQLADAGILLKDEKDGSMSWTMK
ncbi:MAG TPA: DALR domain-containing protein, partial [Chitinophagaceae bacterium]|nr:DALR domain-containing protein [Chitinophagaceae bacterium]